MQSKPKKNQCTAMSTLPRSAITAMSCCSMQSLLPYGKKIPALPGSQITSTSNHTMQLLGFCHFHGTLHNYSCLGFTIQALWYKQ